MIQADLPLDVPTGARTIPPQWQGSATISADGVYRGALRRWWRAGPIVAWLLLNPSTADSLHDDPTLLRLIGWTWRWGYAGLVVVNVYPFRASKPADLWRWCGQLPWWEGPERVCFCPYARDAAHHNVDYVEQAGRGAAQRLVGFGAEARRRDDIFVDDVLEAFQQPSDVGGDEALYCLGINGRGEPLHPMARGRHRVPDDREPILWRAA